MGRGNLGIAGPYYFRIEVKRGLIGPHAASGSGRWTDGVLRSLLEVLQERCDRDDLHRFDTAKVQQIIVSADEPTYAGGRRTGDEFRIVRTSQRGNGGSSGLDGLDEGNEFFFEQGMYVGLGELELRISQDPNVFIKYGRGYDRPNQAGLPGGDEL